MSNGKGPRRRCSTTRRSTATCRRRPVRSRRLPTASADAVRGGGFGLGKALLVGIIGAALVLILSEDARKMVLDRLFGAEEEFEYTSTTTPPTGAAAETPTGSTSS